MENIRLNKVILHILDLNHDTPVLSAKEIEIEDYITDFLTKHISKLSQDGDLKKAHFIPADNQVYSLCEQLSENNDLFIDISHRLTNGLFSFMKQNPSIPSGDVIFTLFESEGISFFAMLKLNYRNSYIHYVSTTDEGVINKLIQQKTTLPGETQKVDECIIINLANFEINLIEKQYEICGAKEYYLSKYFLKCNSDLSFKQKIKILDKTVSKISKRHFDEAFEQVSQMRSCLAASAEESGEIKVDAVAERVFGKTSELKYEYIDAVKKAGLMEDTVTIPEEVNTGKKLKTQKLKTDSGIEINFPSHFYNNPDLMEFINNPDGTISILIKNVSKVMNK